MLLATSATSKTKKIKDIAEYAFNVLMKGIEFSDKLQSDDDLEKVQESINKLQNSIDKVHSMLDYTKQLAEDMHRLLKEKSYFELFNQNIEEIQSCNTDLQYVFKDPTHMVARENLKKCYNIMSNVRAIGRYLSGKPIVGSKPFFESFYYDDGSCKGKDIETIFRGIYTNFIDGCTVVVTAERMLHYNLSTIYRDECWAVNKNISAYMSSFYGKCINQSCSSFHSRVSALLENLDKVDSSTVYNALQRNFPWLQILVIEVFNIEAVVENNGTFFLNSKTIVVQNKVFQFFWTDVFVMFFKNRTNENQKSVNVTVSYRDFESWFFGMNLSYENPLETKRISAFGYTSDQTIDTCKYLPGSDDSPPVTPNSGNRLMTTAFTFVAIIFLELIKSFCYF